MTIITFRLTSKYHQIRFAQLFLSLRHHVLTEGAEGESVQLRQNLKFSTFLGVTISAGPRTTSPSAPTV